MRSVWLCTRNDVIANILVLIAAAGVFSTGTVWPDVGVAAILAVLGLSSGRIVIRQARAELRA
jgi:Co/Zn/Cd efflux system component